jgi:hypothetical protein
MRYSKQLDPSWNQPHQPRIEHGQSSDGKSGVDGEQAEHGVIRDAMASVAPMGSRPSTALYVCW